MRLNHFHRLILEFVRVAGEAGRTDDEITLGLYLHPDAARPRRYELVTAGLVVNSGTRRKGVSGRSGIVWTAAKEAE
ncbi:hypothetical protein CCO03_17065 [Comamonas serinivorans]|uniref:Uncharacterized protein n=1 Tax=Comamonas serinivorans TaxID=1082851 RepID=A0A1Y0ER67_9BURK|nr:hypothetical protein [Comamonas serinivorans]ARU06157.1 hypothetical protein CCO03_17065 [Comamonas serinivorans]